MLGILDRDEKALILAEINSFLKGSGLNALTEHATEEEIRNALGAVISLSGENATLFAHLKTNSLAYLMIARAKPEQALLTLIQLQSLFTGTKTQDLLLRDVLLVARINDDQTLLANLGYIPENDKRNLGPQEISVHEEFNHLHAAVKTKEALFELAKSCSSPIQFFIQFTRLDFRGRTFLHHAAIHNTLEALITYFPSPELFKFLTQPDHAGNTPLSLMAELHPIDNLARILNRFTTNEMREKALCSLDSEGISLLEYCISLKKSPFPLLSTLPPSQRWDLLWRNLPNRDITLFQKIVFVLPIQNLFNVIGLCHAETARKLLPSHFIMFPESWQNVFHYALEENAFIVLEMLAFLFRELGQEAQLVIVLNRLDQDGKSLFHRSCESADKLTAVAALYPDTDSLVNAFKSRTDRNAGTARKVTAFQLAFDNHIPATALRLIPADQLSDLLHTRHVNPETGSEPPFTSAFSGNVYYNYLENVFPKNAAPSDLDVDSALQSLLSVLICLPASDFKESIKSLMGMHLLKPWFAKVLKYNRCGEIQLQDGQLVKHTEYFVNAWQQRIFEPTYFGTVVDKDISAQLFLNIIFPADVLQDAKHPHPDTEAQHLIRALLSLSTISRSRITSYCNPTIQKEDFLNNAEKFASLHEVNSKVDTTTIKSLVKLVKALDKAPDEPSRGVFSCSTSITRQWFNEIKSLANKIRPEDCNECFKQLKQVTAHFDWLDAQKLFPETGINYASWILCLLKIFKVKSNFRDKLPRALADEMKNLIKILRLTPNEVKKRFPETPILQASINKKTETPSEEYNSTESDIEYLHQVEENYGRGDSTLQQIVRIKDQETIARAVDKFVNLYGSREAFFAAMMRKDWNARTCLHHAAEAGTLEFWLSFVADNPSLWHGYLELFIQLDNSGNMPVQHSDYFAAYICVLERVLLVSPEIVLPILKRILEIHSDLLNTDVQAKDLFCTLVMLMCSKKLDPNQYAMLQAVVAAFNASLLKENEFWVPVMSVLALLIDYKTVDDQTAVFNTVSDTEDAGNKSNKLQPVLKFINDVLDDYSIAKALDVITCLPEAIRKAVIRNLAAQKDFAICAIARSFCDLVSGKDARENYYYFINELNAYAEKYYSTDKDMTLLINAFQKLVTSKLSEHLFSEDLDYLPNEKICQNWFGEINSLCFKRSDVFGVLNPIGCCFISLMQYLDSYASRSAKEKVLALRKTASIFKAVTNEFTEEQSVLLDFILMPAETARFYKFKDYASSVHCQAPILIDKEGFFSDKKKKNNKKEVTKSNTTGRLKKVEFFQEANDKESDDETDGSEFSQGERKERKEKEPIYTAYQHLNDL